jgi:hypothetical protein
VVLEYLVVLVDPDLLGLYYLVDLLDLYYLVVRVGLLGLVDQDL